MKIHLLLMTALLSICVTHHCESQPKDDGVACANDGECMPGRRCLNQICTKKKDKGAACKDGRECKSAVCTEEKCAQGTRKVGEQAGESAEECESGTMANIHDPRCVAAYPECDDCE